jgi:hypothetical protein
MGLTPRTGCVTDVAVHEGSEVVGGQLVASILDEDRNVLMTVSRLVRLPNSGVTVVVPSEYVRQLLTGGIPPVGDLPHVVGRAPAAAVGVLI